MRESGKQAFAAQQAAFTADRFKGCETLRTNGEQRAGGERKFAKAAVRREKQGNQAVERSARDATYYQASSSEESFPDPSSISGTAEDEPPENKVSIAKSVNSTQWTVHRR